MHVRRKIEPARLLKTSGLISLITLSLFLVTELSIRLLAPQLEERIVWNGVPATVPDKELSYTLSPGYYAVLRNPEFHPSRVEYKTSPQGFRDEHTYDQHKPAGAVRILILGDSFAYGVGTEYSNIWPVVLEQRLSGLGHKAEVIKAGVFGYDTRQEILYLRRLNPTYRPDIVIVALLLNDLFTNLPLSSNDSELPPSADMTNAAGPSPVAQQSEYLHLHTLTLIERLLFHFDSVYSNIYRRTQRAAYFDSKSAILQRQLAVTEHLLQEGQATAAQSGADFIVVSIPQAFQVINTDTTVDVSLVDKELESFAESRFEWISSLPSFVQEYGRSEEDTHYRVDGHLTVRGNLILGSLVADRLSTILAARARRDPTKFQVERKKVRSRFKTAPDYAFPESAVRYAETGSVNCCSLPGNFSAQRGGLRQQCIHRLRYRCRGPVGAGFSTDRS